MHLVLGYDITTDAFLESSEELRIGIGNKCDGWKELGLLRITQSVFITDLLFFARREIVFDVVCIADFFYGLSSKQLRKRLAGERIQWANIQIVRSFHQLKQCFRVDLKLIS